jgi:hypothetical protein
MEVYGWDLSRIIDYSDLNYTGSKGQHHLNYSLLPPASKSLFTQHALYCHLIRRDPISETDKAPLNNIGSFSLKKCWNEQGAYAERYLYPLN